MRLKVLPIFLPTLIIYLVSMDIMAKTEYDSIKIRIKQKMYEITIPKGYHLNSYSSIEEQEYVFSYPDSSCIYIGDFFYNRNESNIKLLGDSIYNLRYQNIPLVKETNAIIGKEIIPLRPDTLELMGVQNNQLIWKDIVMDNVNVGYYNVPILKVGIFNRALFSVKKISCD